jgi:hypothetical protein
VLARNGAVAVFSKKDPGKGLDYDHANNSYPNDYIVPDFLRVTRTLFLIEKRVCYVFQT